MNRERATSIMASFATIKSLSQEKIYQNAYQLLSEFILHIIRQESLSCFQATEMKRYLLQYFGFIIPEAVVKTTSKRMVGITRDKGMYSVDFSVIGNDSFFTEKQQAADKTNTSIIKALVEYISVRKKEEINEEKLTKELVDILLNEQHAKNGEYSVLISEFILKNEKNKEIQEGLNNIREGSILYLGLNYNIGETGSIKKPLTLYLGTEILFSLVGYNGLIYKQLAEDFFSLVRAANNNGQRNIVLRYFDDVKKEIEDYFFNAEQIADKKKVQTLYRPAMIEITKGCTDSSDVRSKRADFFHDIQYAYGILEDPNKNYYDETLFDANLENIEDLEEEEPTRKKEIGLKFVSHINKLRKGNVFSNEFDSEYLIVTNTKIILAISQNQVERIKADNSLDTVSSFAVSLDRITSLLWYKLGRGFGNNSFPSSVDSVLQARLVLSADIARKADQIYSCTRKEFDAGLIDEQKLAFRIIALREKPVLPEELKGDDIEDIMDFSPEVIRRYEIEAESNSKALKEKDELIEAMRNERKTLVAEKDATINSQAAQIEEKNTALAQKDNDLAERDNIIKSQKEENRELQEKLNAFEKKENEKKIRKEKRKKWLGLVWSILWKLLFVAAIVIIAVLICSKINEKATTKVGFIFGIIGTAASVYAVLKNDKDKYFPSDKKS